MKTSTFEDKNLNFPFLLSKYTLNSFYANMFTKDLSAHYICLFSNIDVITTQKQDNSFLNTKENA